MKILPLNILIRIGIVLSTLFYGFSSSLSFAASPSVDLKYVSQVENIINLQRANPNLLQLKLNMDQLIDPYSDMEETRSIIKNMAQQVQAMITPDMTHWQKAEVLRRYLYESGERNGHEPFSYDMDDPLGKSLESRLLHNYLKTQKGIVCPCPYSTRFWGKSWDWT